MRVQKTFMIEIEFIEQLASLSSKIDRNTSWLINTAIQEYLIKMQNNNRGYINEKENSNHN